MDDIKIRFAEQPEPPEGGSGTSKIKLGRDDATLIWSNNEIEGARTTAKSALRLQFSEPDSVAGIIQRCYLCNFDDTGAYICVAIKCPPVIQPPVVE